MVVGIFAGRGDDVHGLRVAVEEPFAGLVEERAGVFEEAGHPDAGRTLFVADPGHRRGGGDRPAVYLIDAAAGQRPILQDDQLGLFGLGGGGDVGIDGQRTELTLDLGQVQHVVAVGVAGAGQPHAVAGELAEPPRAGRRGGQLGRPEVAVALGPVGDPPAAADDDGGGGRVGRFGGGVGDRKFLGAAIVGADDPRSGQLVAAGGKDDPQIGSQARLDLGGDGLLDLANRGEGLFLRAGVGVSYRRGR